MNISNVIRRIQHGRTYYFGTFRSSVVNKIAFVPVIEHSPRTYLVEQLKEGYQRPGSLPRMNKFRQFLKTHPQSLVPPVILSGRGKWQFSPSENSEIGSLNPLAPAAIIDGQHRLGGYVALHEADGEEREIDFLLIDNLTHDEEVAEFFIINNSQVGVPKSLGTWIGHDNPLLVGIGSRIEGDFVKLAWELSTDQSSPFFGRITRTKMGKEHLFALHSVATQLEKMFTHGALVDLEYETKRDISIKYWNLIQDAHPEEFSDIEKLGVSGRASFDHKLLELTGFIAWSQIGNQILGQAYNPVISEMDWEKVQDCIEYLSGKIDWRKDGQYKNATGLVGGPRIRLDMERTLQMRG